MNKHLTFGCRFFRGRRQLLGSLKVVSKSLESVLQPPGFPGRVTPGRLARERIQLVRAAKQGTGRGIAYFQTVSRRKGAGRQKKTRRAGARTYCTRGFGHGV